MSRKAAPQSTRKNRRAAKSTRLRSSKPDTFPIVGIGASAGGFESISTLLKNLRPDTGMAFVIIQHLSPESQSTLASLLVKTTDMPVLEIRDGLPVKPNHVYVLTPNYDVLLEDRTLRLASRPSSERVHMPIDHFFESLAVQEKERAIGVVLSGTGTDGTLGLRAIKAENGFTFAESDATAKYFAMPNSAILAGCVDIVRPGDKIAKELEAIAGHSFVRQAAEVGEEGKFSDFPDDADTLTQIFYLIKQCMGVDFSDYKQSTLRRRMARRMALLKLDRLEDYVELLRSDSAEVERLFNDILINVTSFFRDPDAFAALKQKILPKIIKNKGPKAEIRIWMPGCSTGEEVYSVAIATVEALGRHAGTARVQIFGTDLSEQIISKARVGIYPESIAKDVLPARLRRFFTKTADGSYQISRTIRELCTFARQNVCEDPPFSHIDLIACRNVLIYLGPALQKKCIPIFHYALNPGGYLMLGSSESVGGFADLFALVDKKEKIYVKKVTAYRPALDFHSADLPLTEVEGPRNISAKLPSSDLQERVDRLILAHFSPNAVIVDEDMQVLQFRGATSRYLEHAPGAASLNLLKMVRPDLMVDLRALMHRAITEDKPVSRANIFLRFNAGLLLVAIKVMPFRVETGNQRLFLVTFEHGKQPDPEADGDSDRPVKGGAKGSARNLNVELKQLRDELKYTRESLQAIIEEREATNEELKGANEEIQSSNEELQSINEELETAKEELQSANEELSTVNEELGDRNNELALVNNDLSNLLTSINIPIIIVDAELRVRRVTAPGEKIFNLIPGDVGRPLSNIKPNLDVPELVPLIGEVIETLSIREREVRDSEGRWHQLRIRPYRTIDNKIDGAVITLVEIDQMKRSLADLQNMVGFANAVFDAARDPMLVIGKGQSVKQANRAFRERFKIARADLENARVHELGDGWKLPKLRTWLNEMNENGLSNSDLQVEHRFPLLGKLALLFRAQRLNIDDEGFIVLITVAEAAPSVAKKK